MSKTKGARVNLSKLVTDDRSMLGHLLVASAEGWADALAYARSKATS